MKRTASAPRPRPRRGAGARAQTVHRHRLPPLTAELEFLRAAIVVVLVLAATMLFHLLVVSRFEHSSAQQQAYSRLRAQLASGTAPIGPADSAGKPLAHGTPIAYLEIPAIALREVVVQGTTAADLFSGPGHRRDTPMPGQEGTSVLMGRRAMFGGPFSRIGQLRAGDLIRVTTGQGVFQYKVIGVRREGDPVPEPLAAGSARLTLATAAGRAYLPTGVVRVDADIDGAAVGGDPPLVTAATLPAEESMMAHDARTLWVMALWLQVVLALSVGMVWAWHRWGRAQAWIVFVPILMLVSLSVWGEFARLMPNLG